MCVPGRADRSLQHIVRMCVYFTQKLPRCTEHPLHASLTTTNPEAHIVLEVALKLV